MTVEEKPKTNSHGEQHESYFKTISEVTGVTSVAEIEVAMKACSNAEGRPQISDVIAYLVQNTGSSANSAAHKEKQKQLHDEPKPKTTVLAVAQPQKAGLIDLTSDNSEADDIQKAIEASLQEQPLGVSREEQEISRALEDSLSESKPGSKRKRVDAWNIDLADPQSRRREGNAPVGIKNVGNTCWFSAVVQTFFHLPVVRNLVLHYSPVKDAQDSPTLRFMQELRKLFALMLCTKRSYVDPTNAIEILKQSGNCGGSSSLTPADSQQDVSEFKHKLLDWLEEAFTIGISRPSSPSCSSEPENAAVEEQDDRNPMIRLFRGKVKAEGVNGAGTTFTKEEDFGQWILQVDGFTEIHDSIEASLVSEEIETPSSGSTSKAGQEQWFVKLPPLLTFELSRIQFNQQLSRPEKLHNKLIFPDSIYLDRYSETNKEMIRHKREEVKKLKELLSAFNHRLDRYLNFGSGPKRFPLQDVLCYALEFASNRSPDCSASPAAHASAMADQCLSPYGRLSLGGHCVESMGTPISSPAQSPRSQDISMTTPCPSPEKSCIALPAPRSASKAELKVLQECLTRWRTEVETDVKDLHRSVAATESQISNIYEAKELKQHQYQLHSVVVHDGQATAGHYWAYVRSWTRNDIWLKFNDVVVKETDWQELQRDSTGGNRNASAYCLIYIDASSAYNKCHDLPATDKAYDMLPADLKQVVDEDRRMFMQELEEWQHKHEQPLPSSPAPSSRVLPQLHAAVSKAQLYAAVGAGISSAQESDHINTVLLRIAECEYMRLEQLSNRLEKSLPRHDARLGHIGVYALGSMGLPKSFVIDNIIIDQLLFLDVKKLTPRAVELVSAAQQYLAERRVLVDEDLYKALHASYDLFRKVVSMFIMGASHYHQEKYQQSLPLLLEACHINEQMIREHIDRATGSNTKKQYCAAVDQSILAYYRRMCLLHLNEIAAHQFENDARKADDAVNLMSGTVMNGICDLQSSRSELDRAAAEEIRGHWCNFLACESMEASKSDKLQQLLSLLLDPPREVGRQVPVPCDDSALNAELLQKYECIMQTAAEHGILSNAARDAEKEKCGSLAAVDMVVNA